MPYLLKDDLKTHLYPEIIEEITRQDDTIVERCLSAAIAEVKSYLSRYDLFKLFGTATTDPEIESEHLKNIVKDVACWQLIRLANPNVDLKLFRTAYEDAIAWLAKVQKGQVDPEWPYKPEENGETTNDYIGYSSNPKRTQHF